MYNFLSLVILAQMTLPLPLRMGQKRVRSYVQVPLDACILKCIFHISLFINKILILLIKELMYDEEN